jgi:hypothetical protein
MNIAFATAIIFILLIPGILFRRFYFSGEFSKQFFKSTAFELFASTSIPSILLHVIWIAGVSRFTGMKTMALEGILMMIYALIDIDLFETK